VTAVLEARDITVRFGGLTALSGVSAEVPERSIVGLVGPNGAGKSTLFAVLSGLQRAAAGRVFLHGVDVSRASPARRSRSGLARTFQQPELFPGMTVRAHLVLAYRLHHTRRRLWQDIVDGSAWRRRADPAEDSAVDALLDGLGIDEIADRQVSGLPLGLSRLVEMGRALATGPSVLLLDEPASGLDRDETQRFVDVLRSVPAQYGASILLVEHDVDLVLGLSSAVYVLDFGRLIARGSAAEIRRDPAVRAAYLGTETVEPEATEGALS
jgi:branched-chain amino acid transport system ATP-binding protein